MAVELCGAETPTGPCTMPKDHSAQFHRHRIYSSSTHWIIKHATTKKVIMEGNGVVPLNNAFSEIRYTTDQIVVEITFT